MRRFALVLPLLVALVAPAMALARDGDRGRDRQEDTRGRGHEFNERRDRGQDARERRGRGQQFDEPRGRGNQAAERNERRGDFVPLERVLRQIERRYPGHQLSVNGPTQTGGGYVYRIKWLTDGGAVLYIIADAQTGAILSVNGG
jgi:uncharacterized membrane protein YkoI